MNQNRKAPATLEVDRNIILLNLRAMIGKSYQFKNETDIYTITDAIEWTTDFKVYHESGYKRLTPDEAQKFIDSAILVEKSTNEEPIIIQQQSLTPKDSHVNKSTEINLVTADSNVLKELSTGLMDKFKELRKKPSKEAIDEANAMVGISSAVTNLIKIELSARKMAK